MTVFLCMDWPTFGFVSDSGTPNQQSRRQHNFV